MVSYDELVGESGRYELLVPHMQYSLWWGSVNNNYEVYLHVGTISIMMRSRE
jgi:hypothetical protein